MDVKPYPQDIPGDAKNRANQTLMNGFCNLVWVADHIDRELVDERILKEAIKSAKHAVTELERELVRRNGKALS